MFSPSIQRSNTIIQHSGQQPNQAAIIQQPPPPASSANEKEMQEIDPLIPLVFDSDSDTPDIQPLLLPLSKIRLWGELVTHHTSYGDEIRKQFNSTTSIHVPCSRELFEKLWNNFKFSNEAVTFPAEEIFSDLDELIAMIHLSDYYNISFLRIFVATRIKKHDFSDLMDESCLEMILTRLNEHQDTPTLIILLDLLFSKTLATEDHIFFLKGLDTLIKKHSDEDKDKNAAVLIAWADQLMINCNLLPRIFNCLFAINSESSLFNAFDCAYEILILKTTKFFGEKKQTGFSISIPKTYVERLRKSHGLEIKKLRVTPPLSPELVASSKSLYVEKSNAYLSYFCALKNLCDRVDSPDQIFKLMNLVKLTSFAQPYISQIELILVATPLLNHKKSALLCNIVTLALGSDFLKKETLGACLYDLIRFWREFLVSLQPFENKESQRKVVNDVGLSTVSLFEAVLKTCKTQEEYLRFFSIFLAVNRNHMEWAAALPFHESSDLVNKLPCPSTLFGIFDADANTYTPRIWIDTEKLDQYLKTLILRDLDYDYYNHLHDLFMEGMLKQNRVSTIEFKDSFNEALEKIVQFITLDKVAEAAIVFREFEDKFHVPKDFIELIKRVANNISVEKFDYFIRLFGKKRQKQWNQLLARPGVLKEAQEIELGLPRLNFITALLLKGVENQNLRQELVLMSLKCIDELKLDQPEANWDVPAISNVRKVLRQVEGTDQLTTSMATLLCKIPPSRKASIKKAIERLFVGVILRHIKEGQPIGSLLDKQSPASVIKILSKVFHVKGTIYFSSLSQPLRNSLIELKDIFENKLNVKGKKKEQLESVNAAKISFIRNWFHQLIITEEDFQLTARRAKEISMFPQMPQNNFPAKFDLRVSLFSYRLTECEKLTTPILRNKFYFQMIKELGSLPKSFFEKSNYLFRLLGSAAFINTFSSYADRKKLFVECVQKSVFMVPNYHCGFYEALLVGNLFPFKPIEGLAFHEKQGTGDIESNKEKGKEKEKEKEFS